MVSPRDVRETTVRPSFQYTPLRPSSRHRSLPGTSCPTRPPLVFRGRGGPLHASPQRTSAPSHTRPTVLARPACLAKQSPGIHPAAGPLPIAGSLHDTFGS
jgi:hypothetical protein